MRRKRSPLRIALLIISVVLDVIILTIVAYFLLRHFGLMSSLDNIFPWFKPINLNHWWA